MVGVDFKEKEKQSRQALRLVSEMSKEYYGEPLVIAYSGGKDSDVMLALAEKELSVDDFVVANSHTTVDAPETVYHIRNVFKRLEDRGGENTDYISGNFYVAADCKERYATNTITEILL